MKKLSREEMKRVMGGSRVVACVAVCTFQTNNSGCEPSHTDPCSIIFPVNVPDCSPLSRPYNCGGLPISY